MKSELFLSMFIITASFTIIQEIVAADKDKTVAVDLNVDSKFLSGIFEKKSKPEAILLNDQGVSHSKITEENSMTKTEKEEATNEKFTQPEVWNGFFDGPNICMYKFRDIFLFQSSVIYDDDYIKRNILTMNNTGKKEKLAEKPQEKKGIDWEIDSMQSFEEWKKLKLQQQEEQKEKLVPHIPPTSVRAKKSQVNYASQDCGAKILSHNKEAKHVSAILDENRDLYMLNPCSASIWFVIELCEPIQLEELQLCNLELFSSAPKDFTVSLSERFPAREWHSVGTFHANNVRQLQAFVPTTDTKMFAKYIKFDMINHFSHEHFCPLTLVRILGVSMADEFDTEQPSAKEDLTTQHPHEDQDKKSGDNGPINTVINMVKNAMDHVLNGPETGESVDSDQLTSDIDSHNAASVNETESELFLVVNETELSNAFNQIDEKYDMFSKMKFPLNIPKYIGSVNPLKNQLEAGMCWILEFFCKVSLVHCLVHYPAYYSKSMPFLSFSNASFFFIHYGNLVHDSVTKEPDKDANANLILKGNSNEPIVQNEETVMQTTRNDETTAIKTSVHQDNLTSDKVDKPSLLENLEENSKQNLASESIVSDSSAVEEPKHKLTSDSILKENVDKEAEETSNENKKNMEVAAEYHEELHYNNKNENADEENDANSLSVSESTTGNHQEDLNIPQMNMTLKSNASNQAQTSTDQSQVSPTMIINSALNQKDSVFMRLSNRIRALEENMSLSSDYLETLSQRYKKQMDEMQRAFNQTTTRLLSTAKTANENDAKQTEIINLTQRHMRDLDQQIQDLSLAHDQLNFILVERHLSLLLIEILVFVTVLSFCMRLKMRHLQKKIETAENMIEVLQTILKRSEQPSQIPLSFDMTKGVSCHPKLRKPFHSKKSRKKKENKGYSITNLGNGHQTFNQWNVNRMKGKENTGAYEDLPCTAKKSFNEMEWKVTPLSMKNIPQHDKGRK